MKILSGSISPVTEMIRSKSNSQIDKPTLSVVKIEIPVEALSDSSSLITETAKPKSKYQTKEPKFSMVATRILVEALSGSSSLFAEMANQKPALSMAMIEVNVDDTCNISSQVAEIVIPRGRFQSKTWCSQRIY